MGIAFPTNPSAGDRFTAPNGVVRIWDGEKWIAPRGGLSLNGGTLTDPLRLHRDPVVPMEAATRRYLDGRYHGPVNVIRNGAFNVWQRGQGPFTFAINTSGYTADGWIASNLATTGTTQLRIERGAAIGRSANSLRLSSASGTIAVGNYQVQQRIESSVAATLARKRVTLQRVANSTGSISWRLETRIPNTADNWSGGYTVDLPQTAQMASFANVPSGYTFDVSPNAVRGLAIVITPGPALMATEWTAVGDFDLRETPGWPLGPFYRSPTIAPPPEFRDPASELEFCQRYYEKTYDHDTAPGAAVIQGSVRNFYTTPAAAGVRNATLYWPFKAVKRVLPTVTVYNPGNGAAGFMADYNVAGGANATALVLSYGVDHAQIYGATTTSVQSFNFGAQMVASAEL